MDELVSGPGRAGLGRLVRWRTLALVAVVGLLGLFLWATVVSGRGRSLVAAVAAGETPVAPAFGLEAIWPEDGGWPVELAGALADGELSVEELRGRAVVLNFWASWCLPCRDEAPLLEASWRRYGDRVVFVGINVRDLRSDAVAFLRELGVPYVSVRDRSDDAYDAYGLTGVPETYYLDAAGRIVAHTPGAVTAETLEFGIARALAPSGARP